MSSASTLSQTSKEPPSHQSHRPNAAQLQDLRPQSTRQIHLQELANQSKTVTQLKVLQAMMKQGILQRAEEEELLQAKLTPITLSHANTRLSTQLKAENLSPAQLMGKKGGSEESEEESSSEEEEEEEEDDLENDPSVVFKESSGKKTYRSGRSFYDTKTYSTRDRLTELQTDPKGNLRSGQFGRGEIIPIDRSGREKRTHTNKSNPNKRPDLDHLTDHLIQDQAMEEVHEVEDIKEPMSPNTYSEFGQFLYNDPENLAIISKHAHKGKKTFRRDSIKHSDLKKTKKTITKKRSEFMKLRGKVDGSLQDKKKRSKFRLFVYSHYDKILEEFKKRKKDEDDKGGGGGFGGDLLGTVC